MSALSMNLAGWTAVFCSLVSVIGAEEAIDLSVPKNSGAVTVIEFLEGDSNQIALATDTGKVFISENGQPEKGKPRWRLFAASGLDHPCGLSAGDRAGELYVLQRPELSLLQDTDQDGEADIFRTVTNSWPLAGTPTSGARALTVTNDGTWLVALAPTEQETGASRPLPRWASAADLSLQKGWIVELGEDGTLVPVIAEAGRVQSMTLSDRGQLVVVSAASEGLSPSLHFVDLQQGEKTDPLPLPMSSIFLPKSSEPKQRIGNPVYQSDEKAAFHGQWFIGGRKKGLLRLMPDEVDGTLQGALTDFAHDEELMSDVCSLKFTPNASALLAGTMKGNLIQFSWPKVTPFCVTEVKMTENGFDLLLSGDVNRATAADVTSYKIERLGGDEGPVLIEGIVVEPDGLRISLEFPGTVLKAGSVYKITADGLRLGETDNTLSHGALYYTVNRTMVSEEP